MRARRNGTVLATLLLLALGAGCASTPAAPTPVEVRREETREASQPAREPSAAAQRKFADAVKFWQEQRKTAVVDYDKVAKRFEAVLDEDDGLAEAHYNLGVISERTGRRDEAVEHYRNAIRAKPSLSAAYENLAVMMENDGKRPEAEEQYKRILRTYPEDAGARARLADLYREGSDPERAATLAREALLRDPKNLTAYKVLMRVSLERGDLPMGRLVALRAMKIDDKDPELYFTLGEILEKEGETDAAIAQYKRTLAVRGDYLPAKLKLVDHAVRSGNYPAAEKLYGELLKRFPEDAGLHYSLGVALRAQGKLDPAMQAYERARKLAPNDALPIFGTAVILHRYKDAPERALELYRTFVSANDGPLPSDHPVFAYIQECEQLIQVQAETKAAEARAAEEAKAAEQRAREEAAAAKEAQKGAAVPAVGIGKPAGEAKGAESAAEPGAEGP